MSCICCRCDHVVRRCVSRWTFAQERDFLRKTFSFQRIAEETCFDALPILPFRDSGFCHRDRHGFNCHFMENRCRNIWFECQSSAYDWRWCFFLWSINSVRVFAHKPSLEFNKCFKRINVNVNVRATTTGISERLNISWSATGVSSVTSVGSQSVAALSRETARVLHMYQTEQSQMNRMNTRMLFKGRNTRQKIDDVSCSKALQSS